MSTRLELICKVSEIVTSENKHLLFINQNFQRGIKIHENVIATIKVHNRRDETAEYDMAIGDLF